MVDPRNRTISITRRRGQSNQEAIFRPRLSTSQPHLAQVPPPRSAWRRLAGLRKRGNGSPQSGHFWRGRTNPRTSTANPPPIPPYTAPASHGSTTHLLCLSADQGPHLRTT